jgi:hypothetical protein
MALEIRVGDVRPCLEVAFYLFIMRNVIYHLNKSMEGFS